MNLIVIRHGQSEADILNVHEGRANYPLTQLGCRQAALMAAWVSSTFDIDKIIASPLKRADQTAQYLSEATGIGVQYDDDLMEFQNGLLAGVPREVAREKYPVPSVKYPHTTLYGQESSIAFRMRVETAFSKIVHENQPGNTLAIVCHGGTINMLFRCFLHLPISSQVGIVTGDTGVHHWSLEGEVRRVVFAGSLVHLREC